MKTQQVILAAALALLIWLLMVRRTSNWGWPSVCFGGCTALSYSNQNCGGDKPYKKWNWNNTQQQCCHCK